MLMTAQDAVQRERNKLLAEIRHVCSTCVCDEKISVETLENVLKMLKGECA